MEMIGLKPQPRPRLELSGISRRFFDRAANADIDLSLQAGEIHGLIGENGAGKSTLVQIMAGLLAPDSGTLHWEGRLLADHTPAQAQRLGIAVVFQHFALFESMTVAENVALGLARGGGVRAVAREVAAVAERYGLPLQPERRVRELSMGERQRVEVVRCLMRSPRLLILDEPTSVLTPAEAEALFRVLRQLAAEGCAILYISHKLAEVSALCQRVTVLREGRVVGQGSPNTGDPNPAAFSAADLARLMIGTIPPLPDHHGSARPGAVRLEVRALSSDSGETGAPLREISLAVHGGEVVGVAGVAGNGQAALMAVLEGEQLSRAASIRLDGRDAGQLGIARRRALGLAVVPEERLGHSAVPELSLSRNALLTTHSQFSSEHPPLVRWGFVCWAQVVALTRSILDLWEVRPPQPATLAGTLSGGNLQKFVVGRELAHQPGVLVAFAPTWGVDAGAAAAIHQALIDLSRAGAAVLVVSPDLDELFAVSDRIAVLSHGRLSPPRPLSEVTAEQIGLAMAATDVAGEGDAAGEGRAQEAEIKAPEPCPGLVRIESAPTLGNDPAPAKARKRRLGLVARRTPSVAWRMASPLLAVALTALWGLGLLALVGHDPGAVVQAFLITPLQTLRGVAELGVKAAPLALCAMGLALGFRANVWNIGAEGQLEMGACAAAAVALAQWGEEGATTLPLMVVAAVVAGMAWAALPAWLLTRWRASEILTSLMLTYVAGLFLAWLVHGPLRDPDGFAFPESRLFGAAALLPVLIPGTRLHLGALLTLGVLGVAWSLLARGLVGFQLQVLGLAPRAASHAGFSRIRLVWGGLLVSGGLAGLAGLGEVAGPIGQLTVSPSPGYGFTAIIVAFLGRLHPVGIFAAALLLALTALGSETAQVVLGLPQAMTWVFQGGLLLHLLGCDLLASYRIGFVGSGGRP